MNTITLWVDADACPAVMKEILFRAATRVQVPLTLVANHWMKVPASPLIKMVQVESGFDVADDYIVQHVNKDDAGMGSPGRFGRVRIIHLTIGQYFGPDLAREPCPTDKRKNDGDEEKARYRGHIGGQRGR